MLLHAPVSSHRTRRRGIVSFTPREAPALSGETAGKFLGFAVNLSHPILFTPLHPMTTTIRFCAEGF